MSPGPSVTVATADHMRLLGAALAGVCRGGDVLVLTGDLGAGKTTLTQGIAEGLGITERVTSPTFVISRVHENPDGLPLVHVDAYRIGGIRELDDLDLGFDVERGVVVVEWGEGLADQLSDSVVHVVISRTDDDADETRTVTVNGEQRWTDALAGLRWST